MTLVTAAEVVSLAIWLPSGLHSCGPPTLVAPRTFQWNPMTQLDAGQPRSLILAEDVEHPGLWRIEWFDSAGAVYITVFAGPSAGERARDYTTPLGTGDYARIWRGLPDDRPPSWLYLAFAPALSERRHRGLARGS